ncbi:MAG: PilZ domain-containing protein [Terriglobia bacterium]|jgi:hypothetical protein
METQSTRRSDRISLELPLQLSGTDCLGEGYIEEGHTILLSRHGAKIALNRKLAPDQELTLRCLSTSQAVDARVVGQFGRGPDGYFYGVEFLDKNQNPWKIEFPPISEARKGVARLLLECVSCNTRAVSYLSEVEAEVFEANRCLSRHCKTCREMGLWTEPAIEIDPPMARPSSDLESPSALAELLRSQNERQESRVSLRMTACVRTPEFGEEIVFTEDVSRGGFRFKSPKRYPKGPLIEIAVPYVRKSGSIFVLAQVQWDRPLPNEGVTLYGAWYVQVHGNTIQRVTAES